MASAEGCAALADFAANEYADENIRFWIAVQKFRAIAAHRKSPRSVEEADLEENVPVDTVLQAPTLDTVGGELIDTFLCANATSLVNLPSQMLAQFEQPSASGGYHYEPEMFDTMAAEILKLIRNDTYARFKYSDEAENLLWDMPMLGVSREGLQGALSSKAAQARLKPLLNETKEVTGADRVTAWLVDGSKLWTIASTSLGNALLEVPFGEGLAGLAAKQGEPLVVDDAYADVRFDQALDKATKYRTRSLLYVPLMRDQPEGADAVDAASEATATPPERPPAAVVLQLSNKLGEDRKPKLFTIEDAAKVRNAVEGEFIDACDMSALNTFAATMGTDGTDE